MVNNDKIQTLTASKVSVNYAKIISYHIKDQALHRSYNCDSRIQTLSKSIEIYNPNYDPIKVIDRTGVSYTVKNSKQFNNNLIVDSQSIDFVNGYGRLNTLLVNDKDYKYLIVRTCYTIPREQIESMSMSTVDENDSSIFRELVLFVKEYMNKITREPSQVYDSRGDLLPIEVGIDSFYELNNILGNTVCDKWYIPELDLFITTDFDNTLRHPNSQIEVIKENMSETLKDHTTTLGISYIDNTNSPGTERYVLVGSEVIKVSSVRNLLLTDGFYIAVTATLGDRNTPITQKYLPLNSKVFASTIEEAESLGNTELLMQRESRVAKEKELAAREKELKIKEVMQANENEFKIKSREIDEVIRLNTIKSEDAQRNIEHKRTMQKEVIKVVGAAIGVLATIITLVKVLKK